MPDWSPTVAQVGSLLRTRTKGPNMEYLGTFTTETVPTEDQVESLIPQAVGEVEARTGEIPESLESRAGNVAALYAAMLVELSYFPEQVGSDVSPYDQLKELFDGAMEGLLSATMGNSPRKGLYSVPLRGDTYPEVIE